MTRLPSNPVFYSRRCSGVAAWVPLVTLAPLEALGKWGPHLNRTARPPAARASTRGWGLGGPFLPPAPHLAAGSGKEQAW